MAPSNLRARVIMRLAAVGLAALLCPLLAGAAGAADADHARDPASTAPLVRSQGSGRWSDAAIWSNGRVPGAGDRVRVRAGHEVIYDVESGAVIRSIHVAGTLRFDGDRDTRLDVGLIRIQPGDRGGEHGFDCDAHAAAPGPDPAVRRPALLVGTPEQPIAPGHRALLRLHFVEGLDEASTPAIVSCGGRMDFHGAPMNRTWVKLGATADQGDTHVTLSEPVEGWGAGDRVIITATQRDHTGGTRRPKDANREVFTEQRTIEAIDDDGRRLALDQPLGHEHLGDGLYRGEVANLSRNVVVESADPDGVRGHMMYHRGSAGAISYAEFRHLGKEGELGKYPIHFHRVRDTMRGSYVIGASVWDSHNRFVTIHGTDYMVLRDTVGYQSVGHGFFLEDGTEVFNLLDRNLAVQAFGGSPLPKQELPFDRNSGAGFWWANSLNSFTRNVAVENDRYGFRLEATPTSTFDLTLAVPRADGGRQRLDIRTLPFFRYENNESHSNGFYGMNLGEGIGGVGPDPTDPFILRNVLIWNEHYAIRPQSPATLIENLHVHDAAYGVYHPNYDHHVYRDVVISDVGAEPFNRGHDDISGQDGPLTVDGLTFVGMRDNSRVPLIQISDDNKTGHGVSHFRNVRVVERRDNNRRALINRGGGPRPTPTTDTGVPIYLHDWYGTGEHALILSTAANDYPGSGAGFAADEPLTGDESRVATVGDVDFPELLDPRDSLPPVTTILRVSPQDDGRWLVTGLAHDNAALHEVVVNGQPAALEEQVSGVYRWTLKIDAPDDNRITARARDDSNHRESRPHRVLRLEDGLLHTLTPAANDPHVHQHD